MYIYTQIQINKFSSSHLVDTNLSVVKVPVAKAAKPLLITLRICGKPSRDQEAKDGTISFKM